MLKYVAVEHEIKVLTAITKKISTKDLGCHVFLLGR
jgi:hypothetical protein